MSVLEIRNLHVQVEGKEILKGLHLTVEQGRVHALMGPNGSGKSTLANTLMGHPKYEITQGTILFNGEDITSMDPDERSRKGIFLSFQYPSEIPGVSISNFLRSALNARRDTPMGVPEFTALLKEKMSLLDIKQEFLTRGLNTGFSGGEKKRAEILQMLMLDPHLAILDETDSGLDIDALRVVAQGVNLYKKQHKTILIITHYKRILELIRPDVLSILVDGKIAHEGSGELVDHLEEKGYGWIQE